MAPLEQTVGLHLQQTLSPQMQQSLQILQAPLHELRQLIAKELAENPVLEEVPPASSDSTSVDAIPQKSALDDLWEPYYTQQRLASSEEENERYQFLMDSLTRPPTLAETLREQTTGAEWTPEQRRIVDVILGNLNASGFLEASVEEIAYLLNTTPLQVENTLTAVQDLLEPPGLAARDLKECLLIQLRRMGRHQSLEAKIVKRHLELAARRRFQELAKIYKTDVDTIQQAVERISRLDPNPARGLATDDNPIIVPEVIVEKDGEDFTVRINNSELPELRLNDHYKDLLAVNGSAPPEAAEARDYIREKIRSGRFFIRSIQQRQETLLAIATEIVHRQRDFMEHGPDALKPMTMSEVAEAVGVHETTVSRAVSGKYMATPHGVFDMKFFFTSGFKTADGEAVSNETVRRMLQNLIASEDPSNPLSDEQIVHLLAEAGIKVARRTIAKYRDRLNILPSHLRKK